MMTSSEYTTTIWFEETYKARMITPVPVSVGQHVVLDPNRSPYILYEVKAVIHRPMYQENIIAILDFATDEYEDLYNSDDPVFMRRLKEYWREAPAEYPFARNNQFVT